MSRPMSNMTPPSPRRPPMRAGGRIRRVVVPMSCVGLIVASLLFIASYVYRSNRQIVLDISVDLLDSVQQRIAAKVASYLEPATNNAVFAARLGAVDSLAEDPDAEVVDFSVEVLRQHPQLSMVNIADTEGNFIMPKEFPDGGIDTKIIDRREGEPTVRWIRRDPRGNVLHVEQVEYDGYDPRERPWYRGALETGGLYWTDVYILFTDRRPGMTAAYPIYDDQGDTLGVIGVDIELDDLCAFLAGLPIGKTGRAMIIDDHGTLIAYPDVERISRMDGQSLRPVTVAELGDPVLTRAYSRFQVERHGRREIEVDGAIHITAVEPLLGVGRDWSIMIVVPEEDFVGLLRSNNRTALAMSVVVVVLGVVLAALLATQGLRADRNAMLVRRREEELETRSRAFSGMIGCIADRARDSMAVVRAMTELAAAGAGVQRVSVWRLAERSGVLHCIDSFERGAGHSDGSELKAGEYPAFFSAIGVGEAIDVTDDDQRYAALVHTYLEPLRVKTVQMVPVMVDGAPLVWVWFEHTGASPRISADDRAYADAIAGILALGCGEPAHIVGSTTPADVSPPEPSAEVDARLEDRSADDAPGKPIVDQMAPVDVRRSFAPADAVPVYDGALVMALCVDAPDLLLASAGNNGHTVGGAIARRIERAAEADEITHWMAVGSIVCCVNLSTASSRSVTEQADALARLAMELRHDLAAAADTSDEAAPARFAIDQGEVGVMTDAAAAGGLRLAGRAIAGAIALARSAPPGAIQLSASAEQALEANFVCRQRGPFFVDGLGELQTFVLVGRLRR